MGGHDANSRQERSLRRLTSGSWADFPPFPRMVIWPVLQSISSKLRPTTSPARTPSLASSSKMAWFRLPTDVVRSQHSRIRSTAAAGKNLGSVESDQLGTVGTQASKIGSDYSAVPQITKERPKRRYHQPGPHRTQLMCVTQNESGDVRCPYHGEVRNRVVKSLGQELLRDGHVVEQRGWGQAAFLQQVAPELVDDPRPGVVCDRLLVLFHNAFLAKHGQQSRQRFRLASADPLLPTAKSQISIHNLAVQRLDIDVFLSSQRLKSAITTICCLIES